MRRPATASSRPPPLTPARPRPAPLAPRSCPPRTHSTGNACVGITACPAGAVAQWRLRTDVDATTPPHQSRTRTEQLGRVRRSQYSAQCRGSTSTCTSGPDWLTASGNLQDSIHPPRPRTLESPLHTMESWTPGPPFCFLGKLNALILLLIRHGRARRVCVAGAPCHTDIDRTRR